MTSNLGLFSIRQDAVTFSSPFSNHALDHTDNIVMLMRACVFAGAVRACQCDPEDLGEQSVFVLSRWWPGFWLIGPLAMVGLWCARPYRWRKQVVLIYPLAIAVSLLPFFVTARFRAPLLPVTAR